MAARGWFAMDLKGTQGELPSQLEVPTELIDSTHQYLCYGLINLNVLPPDED